MIIGYADRLSLRPGDATAIRVCADQGEYTASWVRLVGVNQADNRVIEKEAPAVFSPDSPLSGSPQRTRSGSFLTTKIVPRTTQLGVASWWRFTPTGGADSGTTSVLFEFTSGGSEAVRFILDRRREHVVVEFEGPCGIEHLDTGITITIGQWFLLGCFVDRDRAQATVRLLIDRNPGTHRQDVTIELPAADSPAIARVTIGASFHHEHLNRNVNARVEDPALLAPDFSEADWLAASDGWHGVPDVILASWNIAPGVTANTREAVLGRGTLELVNGPTTAMRGRSWQIGNTSWLTVPEQYSACDLHSDDLRDCGWTESFTLTVPDDAESGAYAVRLTQGEHVDHIPLYVRPNTDVPSKARVLFLAPTNTYLAYANERMSEGARREAASKVMAGTFTPDPADDLLARHPEFGRSVYDCHDDGFGVTHSSRLRPILNFRPNYSTWLNSGRRHYAADFYIIDWLQRSTIDYDVATDEDLDDEGLALLQHYDVVVTGSHPEYWSANMMRALESYLSGFGHLMYLGGNGFYWVTSFADEARTCIEVRRGYAGQRTWSSHPAEMHHASTGELGGLWTHRGHAPQQMVGVGSAVAGYGPGRGYRRTDASYDPRFQGLFTGITENPIGRYGFVLGGAAGDELDRFDPTLADDTDVTILMSSEQMGDYYAPFIEIEGMYVPGRTGPTDPNLRSDVVITQRPGGSHAFSVGSICWASSMAWNEYDNDVARLTTNALNVLLGTPTQVSRDQDPAPLTTK